MEPRHPKPSQAAAWGLAATTAVVGIKMVGAWASGSVSVFGEALQSTLDILTAAMVLWAIKVAERPADHDHPFGHAKAELLTSFTQMIIAMAAAGIIVFRAVPRLFDPQPIRADLGLAAMAISVAVNLVMISILSGAVKRQASPALKGEVAHLWSDTAASAGVLIGLALTWALNMPIVDPIAAVVLTAVGAAMVVKHLLSVIHPLMDGALPKEEIEKIQKVLDTHEAVRGYHDVMTRSTGRERRVQLHVLLDDDLTFVEAHDLAEQIEEELQKALGGAWVTIHYEPHRAELKHREQFHPEAQDGTAP